MRPHRPRPAGRRFPLAFTLSAAVLVVVAFASAAALTSSSAEAQPAQAPPQSSAPPVVAGTPSVGQTLTASSGSWTGDTPMTFSYTWRRCDSNGANCAAIAGASGNTYVAAAADVGSKLRARVTATNAAGQASADSDATATVTAATAPANTGEPVVSGSTVQGQTLTATNGSWTGTTPISYAYQWVRCGTDGGAPDGSNCASIPNATAASHVLQSADVGQRLRVRVTATNSAGSTTVASNATAVVTASTSAGAPRNTSEPAISGTARQGETLSASAGSWAGAQPISHAYQWLRCDANGNNCVVLGGQTRTTYVLTSDDVNRRLRVRVTALNSQGSASATSNTTAQVQPPAAPPSTQPPGAIRLPDGKTSIPISSVSLPARLIVSAVQFTPNPVRSRFEPFQLRVRVTDTRGYAVRDTLVFARSTPLVTSTPAEATTGQDGWATLTFAPRAGFSVRGGHNVQFFVRARKGGEDVLAGVSTRRLVQVRTAR